jgi:hypothetical protein
MRADPTANTRGLPTLPALASPLNGIVEIAGPDQFRLDELIHKAPRARNDPRDVTTDPHARKLLRDRAERANPPTRRRRTHRRDPIGRLAQLLHGSAKPAPSVRGA